MTVEGSLVRRVLVAALLVVALVGMHHLVASGCARHINSHEVAHLVDGDPPMATTAHEITGSLGAVDFDWVQAPEDSGTSPDATALMTCVAILLLLVLLIRPGSWSRHRLRLGEVLDQIRSGVTPVVLTPDLRQLSISRT